MRAVIHLTKRNENNAKARSEPGGRLFIPEAYAGSSITVHEAARAQLPSPGATSEYFRIQPFNADLSPGQNEIRR
jgi:hypothetical protein